VVLLLQRLYEMERQKLPLLQDKAKNKASEKGYFNECGCIAWK